MEIFDKSLVKELLNKLKVPSSIVITTHQNPDGDAVGSVMALYGFLTNMGHRVTPIVPNDYPAFLQWMPGNHEAIDFLRRRKYSENLIESADCIFFLDYNDIKRSADMQESLKNSGAMKVMIDHHPLPQMELDYSFSFTEASSTCELVYEFIEAAALTNLLDNSIATCIYTGIMTDTGCFSYNSSRPRTFEIVGKLLGYSIDKDGIASNVFNNHSESRMRLLGYCLNDLMQVFPQYSAAHMALTIADQDRFKFTIGDSEGFVNYPLSIKGVYFTAFFTEKKDKVKISFRSRGKFPVNEFAARHFSGGGHRNAAGGESLLSLAETIKKFEDLLPLYEKEINS